MKLARRWLALLGVAAMLTAAGLTSATPALAAIIPDSTIHITLGSSDLCLSPIGDQLFNMRCLIDGPGGRPTDIFAGHFRVVNRSSTNYQIIETGSGKCPRLAKTSTDSGVGVVLSTCNGDLTGLWKIAPVPGRPTYRLVSAHSGKCLSNADGSVQQLPCGTTTTSPDQVMFPPTSSYQPVAQPAQPYQPIVGVQAATAGSANSPVIYSYVDNLQRLRTGTQVTPGDGAVAWDTPAGGFAYTGQPQLATQKNGRAELLARDMATGDVFLQDQIGTGAAGFGAIQDVGGAVSTQPVIGTDPVDQHLVVFSLVNGGLWHLPEAINNTYTPYGAWRFVGGSGLVGTPTVVSLLDRIQVFAFNAAGQLLTAAYQGGQLSDWTNLGGSGLNGTPSVVVYPGFWTRVFARSTDGTIVTRKQNNDGTWTADWTSVGDFAGAGSPSAVLDSNSGRTGVVVRGGDHQVHFIYETGQLTGQWGDWQTATVTGADTDPVVFPFKKGVTNPDGSTQVVQTWGFAVRHGDNEATAYWANNLSSAPAGLARSAQAEPTFAHQDLPLPK